MTFEGFPTPTRNYFPMPNEIINIIADIKNLAELKVILYLIRHTWGFHEYGIPKAISTDEFMRGRRRRDGSRIDEGTKLSNRSVIDGLRAAEEHGYLISTVNNSDKARTVKSYQLKMMVPPPCEESLPYEESSQDDPMKNLHKPYEESSHPAEESSHPVEESSHRTEKDTKEKHFEKDTQKDTSSTPLPPFPPNGGSSSSPSHLQKNLPIVTRSSSLRKTRMVPIEDSLEEIKPLPAPSKPGKEEPWNVPTCLRLADYYRGHPLEESKAESSPYQKALRGATKAIQHGHTYEQIDSVFGYMKCLDPNFKDEWWKDKVVDLWHVAEHCSVKLREIERKKRGEPQKPPNYVIRSQDPEYCPEEDFGSKSETERFNENEIKRQAAFVSG